LCDPLVVGPTTTLCAVSGHSCISLASITPPCMHSAPSVTPATMLASVYALLKSVYTLQPVVQPGETF